MSSLHFMQSLPLTYHTPTHAHAHTHTHTHTHPHPHTHTHTHTHTNMHAHTHMHTHTHTCTYLHTQNPIRAPSLLCTSSTCGCNRQRHTIGTSILYHLCCEERWPIHHTQCCHHHLLASEWTRVTAKLLPLPIQHLCKPNCLPLATGQCLVECSIGFPPMVIELQKH